MSAPYGPAAMPVMAPVAAPDKAPEAQDGSLNSLSSPSAP
jgi:hypothetical protein